MGLFSWDLTPAKNAVVDPLIVAQDGASARSLPATIRGFMSGMRRFTDDVGGALTTTGRLNAYVVDTHSGLTELRAGLKLLVQADRDNTAESTLNVDGLGPLPWVDAGGVPLPGGRILKDRFYSVICDPAAPAWRVQAGASTLDEIPGLIDLRTEVSANASAAAADAEATAAAQAEVAVDRTITETHRIAAAAALEGAQVAQTGAEAARDVVQGAVDNANAINGRVDSLANRAQGTASTRFAIPFADAQGNVAGGLRQDGRMEVRLANGPTRATAAPGWAQPVIDADGNVVGGFRSDGRFEARLVGGPARATAAPGWAMPFTDGAGNVLGGFRPDGRLEARLAGGATRGTATPGWAMPVTDASGNILGGWRPDGKLEARLANGVSRGSAHPVMALPFTDPKGNVLGYFGHDRRFVCDMGRPDFDVFPDFDAQGRRRAYAFAPDVGEIDISTGEFDDVVAASSGGSWAYWTGRNAGGVLVRRRAWLRPAYTFAAGVDTLIPVLLYGQSLIVGAAAYSVYGGQYTVETPSPLNPGRAVMFGNGVRFHGDAHTDPTLPIDERYIEDLTDLRERLDDYWGETVASRAGQAYLASAPANHAIAFAAPGVGGQPYANLRPGTVPYANLLVAALRFVQIARLKGKAVPQIVVFWRQGESNGDASEAVYRGFMLELSQALNRDVARITGQTVPVRIVSDQISSGRTIAGPALAMLSLALEFPDRFTCIEPKYEYGYADTVHMNGMSQAQSGAKFGRTLKRIVVDGVNPLPLYAASAVRSGNVVTLTFAGGDGSNLVLDTSLVTDPGGARPMGFEFTDDTASASALSVAIAGPRKLAVTLSGTPTGANPRIDIAMTSDAPGDAAGPTTSPRSCLRETTQVPVTINGTTRQQSNRASHQQIAVAA